MALNICLDLLSGLMHIIETYLLKYLNGMKRFINDQHVYHKIHGNSHLSKPGNKACVLYYIVNLLCMVFTYGTDLTQCRTCTRVTGGIH